MSDLTLQEDRYVARQDLDVLLAEWHDPAAAGVTRYLPPGSDPRSAGVDAPREALAGMERSPLGAVVFDSPAVLRVVLPPFPVEAALALSGCDTGPLRGLLARPRRVGVLLLRLGRFAVGIYNDGVLEVSKTGSRLVHGRHRKGGSSSARFARRREGQAQVLFDAACRTFHERVGEYAHALDHVVLGGQRETLLAFRKACPFMEQVTGLVMDRVLNVGEPSRKELDRVPRLLYQSRVMTFAPSS